MKKRIQRVVSISLTLATILMMLPMQAFAAEIDQARETREEPTQTATAEVESMEASIQEEGEELAEEVSVAEEPAEAESLESQTAEVQEETIFSFLSGSVTDEKGNALSGVSVSIYSLDERTVTTPCWTNESGVWTSEEYDVIKGDSYLVSYYKAGYEFAENDFRCVASSDGTVLDAVTAAPLAIDGIVCDQADYAYTVNEETKTAAITGYTGDDAALLLPAELGGYTVTSIESKAFQDNTSLITVIFSESITQVGGNAFSGCNQLETVYLTNQLTTIQAGAFKGCTSLTAIDIPDSVTTLYGSAFLNCSNLEIVGYPVGLSKVPSSGATYSPFKGCTSLKTVEIPEGVTEIPSNLFWETSLRQITLPESVTSVGSSAFRSCMDLVEVKLSNNLTAIGSYGFGGCTGLRAIQLPESLVTLDTGAFSGCTGLTGITIPEKVATIGGSAFSDCTNLGKVVLSEGLTTISGGAFKGCTSLTAIDIPDSVTTLYGSAFLNCSNLETVGYPVGLSKVPSSGATYSPFKGCTSLKTVEIPEGIKEIPSNLFRETSLRQITLPKSVTSVGSSAFRSCTNLVEVNLSNNLTAIGSYGFSGCTGLRAIQLPESLVTLDTGAFSGCTGLTGITIPEKVATIGGSAFSDCTNLGKVVLSEGLTTIQAGAFKGCTSLTAIDIPDSVTTLYGSAFLNCSNLETVGYPVGLSKVPSSGATYSPFKGCTSLKTVEIPEGVTEIPSNLFWETSLRQITLPESVTSVGSSAFRSCMDLVEVKLSNNLAAIGSYGFSGCTSLTGITIPEKVVTIGGYAFSDCTNLGKVVLSEGLTTISGGAFKGCTSLTAIDIPDSVTEIGNSAFYGCTSLKAVVLSNGLKTIGSSAFANCSQITDLVVPGSVTKIAANSFTGIPNLVFYCSLTSYAATYAIDCGIPIVDTGNNSDEEDLGIDVENCYYQVNGDGVSPCGYLNMTAKYTLKDSISASNMKLTFNIPDTVELVDSTLRVNGALCDGYIIQNGTLTVPVTESSGVIRFSLKPLQYDRISMYAKLTFRVDNTTRTEVIGTVYTEIPILSIASPGQTANSSIQVTGVTIPNNVVDLYVNNKKQCTVTANQAGNYYAVLSLENPTDGKTYTIAAESVSENGTKIRAESTTKYVTSTPILTGFTLEYEKVRYDLLDLNKRGIKPTITWIASQRPFTFKLWFENSGSISSVYVVSTRNGIKKYIRGVWNEAEQCFIAEGHFDEQNKLYVPGTISVEYVHSNGTISFTEGFDYTSEEAVNSLPDAWKDATLTVNEKTDDVTDVTIQLPKSSGSEDDSAEEAPSIRVVTKQQPIPSDFSAQTAESKGYRKVVDDQGKAVFTRVYEKPDGFVFEAVDLDLGKLFTQSMNVASGGSSVTSGLGNILDILDLAEYATVGLINNHEYSLMRADILSSKNLTENEKAAALKQVDDAMIINTSAAILKMLLVVWGVAFGATFGLPGVIIAAIETKLAEDMIEQAEKYTMWLIASMMYNLQEFKFNWHIDPSGYVYDDETKEFVVGATVTAYWVPFDESNASYWDEPPSSDEYGEIWDATTCSQMNPLTTDANGYYAWDVPEGWWRVKYEREGYETTWSEWLPVPPPQTEVNIGMNPIDASEYRFKLGDTTDTSVSVTLTNTTQDALTAVYVLAAYDVNGKLLDITSVAGELAAQEAKTLSVSCEADETIALVKGYVLDENTYAPLTSVWSRVCS